MTRRYPAWQVSTVIGAQVYSGVLGCDLMPGGSSMQRHPARHDDAQHDMVMPYMGGGYMICMYYAQHDMVMPLSILALAEALC